ncbi:MAG: flagellar hook-length control protein FliK, partial [Gammaproteobacteria bacterium]
AQLIQHSGIYLEAKLLSDHTTRNTGIELHPAQAKAIPDLKATLAQLLSIAKTLTNPFAAEQGAAASLLTELDHSNANNINTNANANVNANANANKDIATIERQFNALLTQLMRAQQSPSSPGEANTLTNALALSALLSYLQQLQPNTRSPTRSLHANSLNGAAAQFNQTGWDLLLSLLAGSPRTHRQASPSASASLNSSNALLEGLIHKLEAKLSSIRSTQLHLLTQRENASETKTLCTSTLHIQTDTSIDQIPVHITQHETHSNTQHRASPDKVWTFQLGFDLEEKGIVFANGQYQDGSLMLTFQTANTSTQQHIAQNIAGLHAPLQQHGIVVSRVEIEAPPDASASSQVSTPCASDTMLTEIKLIDITL